MDCAANQQGCKHVERVTSCVVEECASKGGEGFRAGGLRSPRLEPSLAAVSDEEERAAEGSTTHSKPF